MNDAIGKINLKKKKEREKNEQKERKQEKSWQFIYSTGWEQDSRQLVTESKQWKVRLPGEEQRQKRNVQGIHLTAQNRECKGEQAVAGGWKKMSFSQNIVSQQKTTFCFRQPSRRTAAHLHSTLLWLTDVGTTPANEGLFVFGVFFSHLLATLHVVLCVTLC